LHSRIGHELKNAEKVIMKPTLLEGSVKKSYKQVIQKKKSSNTEREKGKGNAGSFKRKLDRISDGQSSEKGPQDQRLMVMGRLSTSGGR